MTELRFFPGEGSGEIDVALVGGKGASLLRLLDAGLPVPPGAILTTAFFEPWFATLKRDRAWAALCEAEPPQWPGACAVVQQTAASLRLDADRQATLTRLREGLRGDRFAVRSSSPDEDLAGASFAGGYETRLGVGLDELEQAIRACFASSLAARVMVYKRERGFDPFAPRLAVVVQAQIDSEVAGVGFSLNPLDNDYDEAVFDASWGLGESVVAGAVTPDHFVVDKLQKRVLIRERGAKQRSLHLDPAGGTIERVGWRSDELCLADDRLILLTEALTRVEDLYGLPVDIEWAFADGRLYLLQARPITAWVPLPDSMITAPGARRRLYMDLGLSGGLTINVPLSPIGESWMAEFAGALIRTYLGPIPVELGEGDELWFLAGGRMYQDLSNVLWISTPRLLARGQERADALMAATLANIDARAYRAKTRPAWVSLRMLLAWPRAAWRTRRVVFNLLRALLRPERARARYDEDVAAFAAAIGSISADASVPALIEEQAEPVIRHVLETTMPGLLAALASLAAVRWIVPARLSALAEELTRGFDGNVVVEMGAALHRLAGLLEPEDMADPERLAERVAAGELPEVFMAAWRGFLATYGWRGPHEMDLASPRYQDRPILALRQVCSIGTAGGEFDPAAAHAEHLRRRRAALVELERRLGPVRRRLLGRVYRVIDRFAGTRDTPKHDYLRLFALVRRRALHEGRLLARAGRLDAPEQVFELRLEDLEGARRDPTLDLRARCRANGSFIERLRVLVKSFPPVIDSRGRISRPAPRPEEPGVLVGMAVSAGVVSGRVKVLHEPDEKPVLAGEILVAHTTDPGWTPLFVNAAAVVLEVGGVLQHGAVVAREYGKPCVAGISELLSRVEDGQLVEVDGSAGVVRILAGRPDGSPGQVPDRVDQ